MLLVLRPLAVAAFAIVVLAGAAPSGRAADCTAAVHARRQAAVTSYRKRLAAARRAYFAKHRSAAQRAAFVADQKKRLARLKASADCTVDSSGSGGAGLPAPVAAPPPTANEHFFFSEGVPADARTEVEEDLAYAVADEQELLGAQLHEVSVFVSTDPAWLAQHACDFYGYGGNCVAQKTSDYAGGAAEGGPRALFLDWSTGEWNRSPSTEKQKTIAHELFHVFQYQLDDLVGDGSTPFDQVRASGPVWLHEGSAEVVGYRVLGDRHLGYSTYPNLLLTEKSRAKPVQTPLDQLLTVAQDRAAGGPYPLYMVAVDHLVSLAPDGLKSLAEYYRALAAGSPWAEAFATAFGLSVDAFSANFAVYRSHL